MNIAVCVSLNLTFAVFIVIILSRLFSNFVLFRTAVLTVCSTESLSLMSVAANVVIVAGGVDCYLRLYSVLEYISRHASVRDDAHGITLTIRVDSEVCETAHQGWR